MSLEYKKKQKVNKPSGKYISKGPHKPGQHGGAEYVSDTTRIVNTGGYSADASMMGNSAARYHITSRFGVKSRSHRSIKGSTGRQGLAQQSGSLVFKG
tara:strand:- start:5063 stop:5356 length:294 start_codon:yes stop_codon:yes gene_type:complete